jgi:hypothetical protein
MRERRLQPVHIDSDFAAREQRAIEAIEHWLAVWRKRML